VLVLLTGAAGMLGTALLAEFGRAGWVVEALTRRDLDIADRTAVLQVVAKIRPYVVVNAAAYTAVDGCEHQPVRAFRVNTLGPLNLGLACREQGIPLVHFSTDYVFDGRASTPYREDAPPRPINVYGKSKLAGERALLRVAGCPVIFRTSWLFGPGGRNFVDTTLRSLQQVGWMRVVTDQVGCPTYTRDLAMAVCRLIARGITAPLAGIYHLTNGGSCSWYQLAQAVALLAGYQAWQIIPTTSMELGRPALRPAFSVLANDRWRREGFPMLRNYRQALGAYLMGDKGICPQPQGGQGIEL